MKLFTETGADPRHPALTDAAMALGRLCAAHDPQQALANLKAAYAAEKPGFRKRALLAVMIAHLAEWRSHALDAISPGKEETEATPDAPAAPETPPIAVSDIGAILQAPKNAKPAKASVFSIQLDATRLLFASMDDDEEGPPVSPAINSPTPEAADMDLAIPVVEITAPDVPPIVLEKPKAKRKTTTPRPRKTSAAESFATAPSEPTPTETAI